MVPQSSSLPRGNYPTNQDNTETRFIEYKYHPMYSDNFVNSKNQTVEVPNRMPRNSNGTLTFQVSTESRESRVNTMMSESIPVLETSELDGRKETEENVSRLNNIAATNNIKVLN